MPWPIKVVVTIRRSGPSGQSTALRNALITAQSIFTTDCLAALTALEPGATVEWSMRADDIPTGGANVKEVYPKCSVTLPTHESNPRPTNQSEIDAINAKLRAVRDAIVARLNSLATNNAWTILGVHTKLYGGS